LRPMFTVFTLIWCCARSKGSQQSNQQQFHHYAVQFGPLVWHQGNKFWEWRQWQWCMLSYSRLECFQSGLCCVLGLRLCYDLLLRGTASMFLRHSSVYCTLASSLKVFTSTYSKKHQTFAPTCSPTSAPSCW
jgi:hypothetical protein